MPEGYIKFNERQRKLVIKNVIFKIELSGNTDDEFLKLLKSIPFPVDDQNWKVVKEFNTWGSYSYLFKQEVDDYIEYLRLVRPSQSVPPLQIGQYHENDLREFSDGGKKRIIKTIVDKYKKCMRSNRSIVSFDLLDTLDDEDVSLEDKWQSLINYCKDKTNHSRTLYGEIVKIIENFDIRYQKAREASSALRKEINELLSAAGKFHYEGRVQEAQTACKNATTAFARVQWKTLSDYEVIGDHNYLVGNYLSATKSYDYILSKMDESEESAQFLQMQDKKAASVHKLLEAQNYTAYIERRDRAGASSHSRSTFLECAKTGTLIGGSFGAYSARELLRDPLSAPAALPAAALMIIGGAVGALAGSIFGFFQAETRSPLTVEEQNSLFNKLQLLSAQSDEVKNTAIAKIVEIYSRTKSSVASSATSDALLTKLESREETTENKWKAIENYMLEQKVGSPLFENNGKKLYCIINNVLKNLRIFIEVQEDSRTERGLYQQPR